jgi:hypothetical protein
MSFIDPTKIAAKDAPKHEPAQVMPGHIMKLSEIEPIPHPKLKTLDDLASLASWPNR